MSHEHELIVIGSGSAGFAAATTARQYGVEKILLMEKRRLGYSLCSNRGCMPSKTLLASADLREAVSRSHLFGIEVDKIQVDWQRVQERMRSLVEGDFFEARREALLNADIEVVSGEAHFVDPHTVEVEGKHYAADRIVIASGSRSSIPPIDGLDEAGYLTSDQALYLESLPDCLLIIGGGFIAVELGYLFYKMGCGVIILEIEPHILPGLDSDLGQGLQAMMRDDGIEIVTAVNVCEVRGDGTRKAVITELNSGEYWNPVVDEILVATGREPAIEGLNLEAAGVHISEQNTIEVNSHLQTNVPHIYAVGDVNDGWPLVHAASMEGRIAGFNVADQSQRCMNHDLVATTIFSHPEIGTVGLTDREAKERGLDVVVGKVSMSDIGKAVAVGQTRGFIKLVAERGSGKILGIHILGPHATDIIQVALPHLYHQDTVFDIMNIPYPHPTLGEALSYAAEAVVEQLSSPSTKG